MRRKGTELGKREFKLLSRYLADAHINIGDARFSVRVGKGLSFRDVEPAWLARLVFAVSRLKIDCVVKTSPHSVSIIEAKKRADTSAIGQLLTYKHLYCKEHSVSVNMILVCNSIHPDIEVLCRVHHIDYYIYD